LNNQLLEIPFAHRGLFDNKTIIENSIPAFEKALAGNHSIELDVHITADKKVVVFHDNNLERLTGIKNKITEINLSELKKIKLKNTESSIPIIEEVLELVNGKVSLLIDIKNGTTFGILENELLKSLKSYKGYIAVHSFSPYSRYWIKKNFPLIDTGQLVSAFDTSNSILNQSAIAANKLFRLFAKPDFLSCNIDLLPGLWTEKLRQNGIPVLSWTIKTKEQLDTAKRYSDNYIWENLSQG